MLKIHKANSLILLLYYNYSHKNDHFLNMKKEKKNP